MSIEINMSVRINEEQIKDCPCFRSNITYKEKTYNNVCLIGLLLQNHINEDEVLNKECYRNFDCLYRNAIIANELAKKYLIEYFEEYSKNQLLENQVKQLKEELNVQNENH